MVIQPPPDGLALAHIGHGLVVFVASEENVNPGGVHII
jgi:hypothetical protein